MTNQNSPVESTPPSTERPLSIGIIGTRGYPSYYGGFETAVRKLAPYLSSKEWKVTVYSRPDAVRLQDPDRDLSVQTVMTRGLDWKSLSTLTFGFSATLKAVRKKHDVVLVMNVANGYWLPILRAFRIPTLVNVDGIEWERAKWGKLAKWVFRSGAKLTARFGDQLVYDSKEIARRWKEDFKRDGAFIPYGGDSPNSLLPLEPGLKHRDYVLLVARFVPENTIQEFFEAAPRIALNHTVVIVGSSGFGGDFDDSAQDLAAKFPNIHWLGHVSNDERLLGLWQHAGVYFHGHSVGGTNPALVQAMACGSPIVARDTPYNREVLGANSCFVEPASASISDKILEILQQPEHLEHLSRQNKNRANSRYSWESVNNLYLSEAKRLTG